MRHKEGCKVENTTIAFSENNPEMKWSSDKMCLEHVFQKSNNNNRLIQMAIKSNSEMVMHNKRLKIQKVIAEEIIYQSKKPKCKFDFNVGNFVNGLYNTHSSHHVNTCWNHQTNE